MLEQITRTLYVAAAWASFTGIVGASLDDDVILSDGAEWAMAEASEPCPSGFTELATQYMCRAAMAPLGLEGWEWQDYEMESGWPAGCYHCEGVNSCSNGVWFNDHASGSERSGTRRICGKSATPVEAGGLVLMGDSDLDNWRGTSSGDGYWATFPNSTNVAIGGQTCRDVLNDDLDEMLDAFRPETVVLVCGENDIGSGVSATKTYKRFKKVVKKIVASGARVIYFGTKDEPDTTNLHDKYAAYDASIRTLASKYARGAAGGTGVPLTMIDVNPSFHAIGNGDNLYANDDLHLSDAGYKLWEAWAVSALASPDCCMWESGSCSCSDDETWYADGSSSSTCEFVANSASARCGLASAGGVYAYAACAVTCGTCGNSDSHAWAKGGQASKDCDWVARKSARCNKKDESGCKAKKACLASC